MEKAEQLVRAINSLDTVNLMRRRETLQETARSVRKAAEELVDRAFSNNQAVDPLEGVAEMNELLDSCMYVSRDNAEGYVEVVPVDSALGAEITSRVEVEERQITEELSESLKRKCAVGSSARASSEGRKTQKPSQQLSPEAIIETRMRWLAKELPPSQGSAELFKFLQKKECETQMQEKTQGFADMMANPAKREEYMTEWNGLYGEFGEFCSYFDDHAELSPLPKSDEGGGGIAKQMCHRKFTTEGSTAVVKYFKGKVPSLSRVLMLLQRGKMPQRNGGDLRRTWKCLKVHQVPLPPLLPRTWSRAAVAKGLAIRDPGRVKDISLVIFIPRCKMKTSR